MEILQNVWIKLTKILSYFWIIFWKKTVYKLAIICYHNYIKSEGATPRHKILKEDVPYERFKKKVQW
jgi:hypothetical protein